mmetsp:Transcript_42025/g.55378  ORF Transcript_42025/g.55378 Transcript_42025/m.55378 type:complete len:148 (-) Transcript_42025:566-1009(-)
MEVFDVEDQDLPLPEDEQHFSIELDRATFNEICEDIFEKCLEPLKQIKAYEEAEEVTKVIFVGGSSRIPRVQEVVEDLCPSATMMTAMNPDEAIALGAAYQAGSLVASPIPIHDSEEANNFEDFKQPERVEADGDERMDDGAAREIP